MGRSVDAARRWSAAAARVDRSAVVRDPIMDRDFEVTTDAGPVRFRVCSRHGAMLRCLQAPASEAMIPAALLDECLAAGTIRRV